MFQTLKIVPAIPWIQSTFDCTVVSSGCQWICDKIWDYKCEMNCKSGVSYWAVLFLPEAFSRLVKGMKWNALWWRELPPAASGSRLPELLMQLFLFGAFPGKQSLLIHKMCCFITFPAYLVLHHSLCYHEQTLAQIHAGCDPVESVKWILCASLSLWTLRDSQGWGEVPDLVTMEMNTPEAQSQRMAEGLPCKGRAFCPSVSCGLPGCGQSLLSLRGEAHSHWGRLQHHTWGKPPLGAPFS